MGQLCSKTDDGANFNVPDRRSSYSSSPVLSDVAPLEGGIIRNDVINQRGFSAVEGVSGEDSTGRDSSWRREPPAGLGKLPRPSLGTNGSGNSSFLFASVFDSSRYCGPAPAAAVAPFPPPQRTLVCVRVRCSDLQALVSRGSNSQLSRMGESMCEVTPHPLPGTVREEAPPQGHSSPPRFCCAPLFSLCTV